MQDFDTKKAPASAEAKKLKEKHMNGEEKKKAKEDNIGLQAFFSVDEKYNQGDLMVAGVFIEDALLDKNGLLEPGESYLGELEINLKRKTSFHANFILHIDPVELVRECDETNNYTAITF